MITLSGRRIEFHHGREGDIATRRILPPQLSDDKSFASCAIAETTLPQHMLTDGAMFFIADAISF